MKRKVTKKDLTKYPELKENRIKVGDEYDFPEDDDNDNATEDEGTEDPGGDRPKKKPGNP